jgi:long-chain fatty acid transport protein
MLFGMLSGIAVAGGFRLPDQDGFATGRGEAFVATADNASAVYYNPAGITQLQGNNIRAGLYGIYLDPTYTPPAPANTNTFHNKNKFGAAPQLFYTRTLQSMPLSFGIGVYAPYGLSLHWSDNTGFRSLGTESALTFLRINPVMALKINPSLSIGAGLTVNYAKVDLGQGLSPFPGGGDKFRYVGSGWGIGYNVGVLWQPIEQLSFGATFRSGVSVPTYGETTISFPPFVPPTHPSAKATFDFPYTAVGGISYRPTPKWNLEFDADYTDWSSLGTVTVRQSSTVAPIPQNAQLILNWQPCWMFDIGATRYLDNGWHVSGGYVLSENSDPNPHYTPLAADVNRHFLSVGMGHKGRTIDFDAVYQFGFSPDHHVKNSAVSPVGQTADGTYDWISHAFLVTVGMHF